MAVPWRCYLCGREVVGVHSIVRHEQNFRKAPDDPSRCDNTSDSIVATASVVLPVPAPAPVLPVDMLALARRAPVTLQSYTTRVREVPRRVTVFPANPRDFVDLQNTWDRYVQDVFGTCCPKFWKFFLPLHEESGSAIDSALRSARNAFAGAEEFWSSFPSTRRVLRQTITSNVDKFWPRVMHTTTIDLGAFDLPHDKRTLDFSFIDPIWAWLMAAQRLPANDMQWVPCRQFHPEFPNRYFYGAGVQFGDSFAQACSTCARGTYPMLMSLHWDGTNAHGMHATPICVGVANTNSMSANTQYCIGYIPVLADMGATFEGISVQVRFSIKQQCVAAILRVMEIGACRGVRCRLPSATPGTSEVMTLMPRLLSMNLDQPERQSYFGMLNRTSCSKCKWRKGRSAFRRRASRQSGERVATLYGIVQVDTIHITNNFHELTCMVHTGLEMMSALCYTTIP